jgi:8-oxo-dGTP pyrophosphatase MutT (NUDIX family)
MNKNNFMVILGLLSIGAAKYSSGSFQRWGRLGSGMLFICPQDNTVLLFKRSQGVLEPGTWGTAGGRVDDPETETAWESALKEVWEETGGDIPNGMLMGSIKYVEPNFEYINYVYAIAKETKDNWEIMLNWENDDYRWIRLDDLKNIEEYPLHFGIQYLLDNHYSELTSFMEKFSQQGSRSTTGEMYEVEDLYTLRELLEHRKDSVTGIDVNPEWFNQHPEHWSNVFELISQFPNLDELNLEYAKLSSLEPYRGSILRMANLKNINLWGNEFNQVPDCLLDLPNLEVIRMNDNCSTIQVGPSLLRAKKLKLISTSDNTRVWGLSKNQLIRMTSMGLHPYVASRLIANIDKQSRNKIRGF